MPRILPLALWITFAVSLLVLSIVPINNHFHYLHGKGSNKDYPMFFQTGQRVLHGRTPYPIDPANPTRPFDYMYPPSFSAMLALLGSAGQLTFVALLGLICTASWIAALRIGASFNPGAPPEATLLAHVIANCVVFGYAWGIYLLGQPIIFLLACLLAALLCSHKNRPWSAGALVALAAAVKAFPVLAIAWFVFRRQWKAVISCFLWLAVLLLVVPSLFRGPAGAWEDLSTWTRATFKYDQRGIAQREMRGGSWRNGSLPSVLNRLLRPVIAENEPQNADQVVSATSTAFAPGTDGPPLYVNFADLPFAAINVIIVVFALGLCAVFLLSVPRQPDRTPRTDAVEFAMMLVLVILFTPLSFTYLNFWVLFPVILSVQFMCDRRQPLLARRFILVGLIVFILLTLLSIPMLPLFHTLRAMGNTLAANILLLAMLALEMRCLRRMPADGSERRGLETLQM